MVLYTRGENARLFGRVILRDTLWKPPLILLLHLPDRRFLKAKGVLGCLKS